MPKWKGKLWNIFWKYLLVFSVDNGASEWWLSGLKATLCITVIALSYCVVLDLRRALHLHDHTHARGRKHTQCHSARVTDQFGTPSRA